MGLVQHISQFAGQHLYQYKLPDSGPGSYVAGNKLIRKGLAEKSCGA